MSSLEARWKKSETNDPSWFVAYEKSTPASAIESAAESLRAQGYFVKHNYLSLINGFVASFPEDHKSQIQSLCGGKGSIKYIEKDGRVSTM